MKRALEEVTHYAINEETPKIKQIKLMQTFQNTQGFSVDNYRSKDEDFFLDRAKRCPPCFNSVILFKIKNI
jgi:hypothetical protein